MHVFSSPNINLWFFEKFCAKHEVTRPLPSRTLRIILSLERPSTYVVSATGRTWVAEETRGYYKKPAFWCLEAGNPRNGLTVALSFEQVHGSAACFQEPFARFQIVLPIHDEREYPMLANPNWEGARMIYAGPQLQTLPTSPTPSYWLEKLAMYWLSLHFTQTLNTISIK